MSHNNAISSSDPRAVEKLTEKLEAQKRQQTRMKDINAHYRKHGTCKGCPDVTDETAAKIDLRVERAFSWDKQPFPAYELQYGSAEIRRLTKRIEEISRNQEVGFSGWEFEGGRAEANTELNRLQLFFDERPDKDRHSAMRHSGFVYSHTNGAYQRQLNDNAIYAAGRLNFLKPLDGRTVREHQPKPPERGGEAR